MMISSLIIELEEKEDTEGNTKTYEFGDICSRVVIEVE